MVIVMTRRCRRCERPRLAEDYVRRGTVCGGCRENRGAPRVCFGCNVMKPAAAFEFGDGKSCSGDAAKFRRRRTRCVPCHAEYEAAKAVEASGRAARMEARRVTFVSGGRLVRRCARCETVKDLADEFYNQRKPAVGLSLERTKSYHCKACAIERTSTWIREKLDDPVTAEEFRAKRAAWQADWRARNPEMARVYQHRTYERTMADPARHRRRVEGQRIGYRLRQERLGKPLRVVVLGPGPGVGPELPAAPLIGAIEAWIGARRGPDDVANRESEASDETLAPRLGMSARSLHRLRHEQESVRLSTIEKALIGLDLLWWEVWEPSEWPEAVRVFEPEMLAVAS